jgi:hypothetical protein
MSEKSPNLTHSQELAIRCAYADLIGALQARNAQEPELHNWEAHLVSIKDLERQFPTIISDPAPPEAFI